MPWCERCDRFLNPNSVNEDGTCPTCGRPVDATRLQHGDQAVVTDDDDVAAPWHFWVMIAGVVLYLGWRLIEALIWGIDRLF